MSEVSQIKINATYRQLYDESSTKLRTDFRYGVCYGGRRSAKSTEIVQSICLTIMQEPGHFVMAIRKVATTLKDSVFAEYVDFFHRYGIKVNVNKTDKEITLPNRSRIRCFGLDDPEKLKSTKGATIVHFEESNECTEHEFDSIDAGLSPNNYPGRIFLTFNPMPQIPGSLHWIQRRFLQVQHELSKAILDTKTNALILRTWYKDNAFCPEPTIKVLEGYKETNPEKYKLWALGEFTKLEGVVFENWGIVASIPESIKYDKSTIGLDWGYASDPAAASRVWIHENDIYIQQLVYKTGLFNEDLFKELKEAGVTENDEIIADCSSPMSIDDLKRKGFNGIRGNKKSANYKEDTANIIKSFRIHIIEGSTDLIREMSTYSWCRDKNGKQIARLQDGDDHLIDGLIMVCAENTKTPEFKMFFV